MFSALIILSTILGVSLTLNLMLIIFLLSRSYGPTEDDTGSLGGATFDINDDLNDPEDWWKRGDSFQYTKDPLE